VSNEGLSLSYPLDLRQLFRVFVAIIGKDLEQIDN